jgi:hypothetical protein
MELNDILKVAESGGGLVAVLLLVWRLDGRLDQVRMVLERLTVLLEHSLRAPPAGE